MSNIPKDKILYNKIKANIYKKIPKHSAYRSGLIVKEYKKQYLKKYKNNLMHIMVLKKKKRITRWFKRRMEKSKR